MKNNVITSKIIANSTENAWAQVYSTLNLYIVISIEDPENKNNQTETIASYGKIALDKLQREFFAIEEKRLAEIKKAVEKTIATIDPSIKYSLILANIVKSVLYIITAGKTLVLLNRGKKTGVIAQGEEGKVISFSGLIENNDIIVFETDGFSKKIPVANFVKMLGNQEVLEIAENIAPIIHGNPKGTEAAILIQYIKTDFSNENEYEDQEEKRLDEEIKPRMRPIPIPPMFRLGIKTLSVNSLRLLFLFKKKILILASIILLVILLAGVIFLDKKTNEQKRLDTLSKNLISSAQSKYNDAQTNINLNKNLARQNLNDAKTILNDAKSEFIKDSKERKDIDNLLAKIDEELKSLEEGNVVKNKNELFNVKNSQTIRQIGLMTIKDGDLTAVDQTSGNITVMSKDDGKTIDNIKVKVEDPRYVTGNGSKIYLLADNNVWQIDKKGGDSKKIIDLANGNDYSGIDTFLGNLYLLNIKDKNIEKYPPTGYKKSAYFQDGTSIPGSPISMSIDGSVWILQNDGKIKKYTKGREEPFEIKKLSKPISSNAILYTDSDFNNIYILDKTYQAIIVINKNGEYQNQYGLKNLENIVAFAVDEKAGKIYAASASIIYSFGL